MSTPTDCSRAIAFVNDHFQGDMSSGRLYPGQDPAEAIVLLLGELLELRRFRAEVASARGIDEQRAVWKQKVVRVMAALDLPPGEFDVVGAVLRIKEELADAVRERERMRAFFGGRYSGAMVEYWEACEDIKAAKPFAAATRGKKAPLKVGTYYRHRRDS